MNYDTAVLDIIKRSPGLTGHGIHGELVVQTRLGRWLGSTSLLAQLFGPSSGIMYGSLVKLERQKKIRSHWGKPNNHGNRPRHYFIEEGTEQ